MANVSRTRCRRRVSLLVRPDGVLDRLDEIRVPTLCIHGEEDVFEIERAAETANGSFARIPEAGHLSISNNRKVVNEALREFLGDIYGRR